MQVRCLHATTHFRLENRAIWLRKSGRQTKVTGLPGGATGTKTAGRLRFDPNSLTASGRCQGVRKTIEGKPEVVGDGATGPTDSLLFE